MELGNKRYVFFKKWICINCRKSCSWKREMRADVESGEDGWGWGGQRWAPIDTDPRRPNPRAPTAPTTGGHPRHPRHPPPRSGSTLLLPEFLFLGFGVHLLSWLVDTDPRRPTPWSCLEKKICFGTFWKLILEEVSKALLSITAPLQLQNRKTIQLHSDSNCEWWKSAKTARRQQRGSRGCSWLTTSDNNWEIFHKIWIWRYFELCIPRSAWSGKWFTGNLNICFFFRCIQRPRYHFQTDLLSEATWTFSKHRK